ncbi:hypothetical protein [Deinococcus roseus]|uniref:hypothetical protein n=1 Tax=Deinococcus roseus TaxID=392414 RepID=UPI0016697FE0|nr:hypothetical protein [Deinococcus roseus]
MLAFHFGWNTAHREFLKPVLWLQESAFLTLQGIMGDTMRRKVHLHDLPSGEADRADRLLPETGRDGVRWNIVRTLRETALVARYQRQLEEEQSPMVRMFRLVHLAELLHHREPLENFRTRLKIMKLHWELVEQGKQEFYKPLVHALVDLRWQDQYLFQLNPEETKSVLWEFLQIHQTLVKLGRAKDPDWAWSRMLADLRNVLHRGSHIRPLKDFMDFFNEVMDYTFHHHNIAVTESNYVLKEVLFFFRLFAPVLSELDLLKQFETLQQETGLALHLKKIGSKNHKEMLQNLHWTVLLHLIQTNSPRQREYGERFLQFFDRTHIYSTLYEILRDAKFPMLESWSGDPHFEMTLLNEAIELYEKEETRDLDLAPLYMERGCKQPSESARKQDFQKALDIHLKHLTQTTFRDLPGSDGRIITDSSLEVAKLYRLLGQHRQGLDVVNQAIPFWWLMGQQLHKRPEPNEHRQEQLTLRLQERVLILEELLATDQPDQKELEALLADTQQTLLHLENVQLGKEVWEKHKLRKDRENKNS